MKRVLAFALILLSAAPCFYSCKKTPELTITSTSNIELSVDGGSGSITFTANRDWSASSSDSWVTLSPSSGTASDGTVTVSVRCNANTTYDDRTATVTIRMEELSQSVTVRQPANLGVVLPKQVFDLQSDAKSIDVEVQANVQYAVTTSVDWIKQTGTKGLTSKTLTFSIEENKTYDPREGKITIKPQEGNAQEQVISVKQAQKDALNVEKTSYDMPYGGGGIEVKVEANVDFEVKPSGEWIQYVETKALSNSTVYLVVAENQTYSAREGTVEITQKNGSLKHTVTVKQAGRVAVTSVELNRTSLTLKPGETATLVATVKPDNATDKTVTWSSSKPEIASVDAMGKVTAIIEGATVITATVGKISVGCDVTVDNIIEFEDAAFKAYCVANFDLNGDGEISFSEAKEVETIDCSQSPNSIQSVNDVRFFINLKTLNCARCNLSSLDISKCTKLTRLDCGYNKLTELDLTNVVLLENLSCSGNQLTTLIIDNCSSIKAIDCDENNLKRLDVNNKNNLVFLSCTKNQLESLSVNGCSSLQLIYCAYNKLESIDLGGCPSLTLLSCYENELTEIDCRDCEKLLTIEGQCNKIKEIKVQNCRELSILKCGDNVEQLDVRSNPRLVNLEVKSNYRLSTLDVSNNSLLEDLRVWSSNITCLDVSNNLALYYLVSSQNPYLTEIWLKKGQVIETFYYDQSVTTIKYKE